MIAHVIKDGVIENVILVEEDSDLEALGAQVIPDGDYYAMGDTYSGNINNDTVALARKDADMQWRIDEQLRRTANWESDSYEATPEQIAYRRILESLPSDANWPNVTIPERP